MTGRHAVVRGYRKTTRQPDDCTVVALEPLCSGQKTAESRVDCPAYQNNPGRTFHPKQGEMRPASVRDQQGAVVVSGSKDVTVEKLWRMSQPDF